MSLTPIVKGIHACQEALASNRQADRLIVESGASKRMDVVHLMQTASNRRVKVQVLDRDAFMRLTDDMGQTQGVLLYMHAQTSSTTLATLMADPALFPIVLAVDHIQDPYNFGAMLRTAEAMGVKAVIYPKDRNCEITPGVIKASAGAVHHLEMIRVVNLASALIQLKDAGYWLYAAQAHEGTPVHQTKFHEPLVLIMGNEDKGVSKRVMDLAHQGVSIPIFGKMESLNVSVAAGILLHHIAAKK